MTTAGPGLDLKKLKIFPLASPAPLTDFSCGEREIDRRLANCCDWHACHRARVFYAELPSEPGKTYGFYCIGPHAHEERHVRGFFQRASDDTRTFVPFIYINYIGVLDGWHNNGIGTMLLLNALERAAVVIRNIGAYGVAIHPLNERSARLYYRYGFRERNDRDDRPLMVLPARAVLEIFSLRS